MPAPSSDRSGSASPEIPATYGAWVQAGPGEALEWKSLPLRAPKAGEARVRLAAAALNHRDLWIHDGQYAGLRYPWVPGSDGVGTVEALGEEVPAEWKGRRVLLNPALDWGMDEGVQGPDFRILGLPDDGTWAESITVPAANLHPCPDFLEDGEAAALPLAGLTAFRALFTRGRLQKGEKVLVTGIGGGVALFCLQLAKAEGARVFVSSSSPEKLAAALALGAEGGALYTEAGWTEKLAGYGPFDLVVDSAGGEGFSSLLDLARPGGRLVFFGATRGNPPAVALRKIFWRQLDLLGTTMGSPRDFEALLAFVARHRFRPALRHVLPLAQAPEALSLMAAGAQFGKIVLVREI